MRGDIFVFSLGNERNGLGKEQNSSGKMLREDTVLMPLVGSPVNTSTSLNCGHG